MNTLIHTFPLTYTTISSPPSLGLDLRIVTDKQGEPWFVAADVAKALGYRDAPNMTRRIDPDDTCYKKMSIRSKAGVEQSRSVSLINESGLYAAIFASSKKEAKEFKNWVTREVLPAIRKDGAYIVGEEKVATGEMTEDELILKAMSALQKKAERLALENRQQRETLAVVTPKADVFDAAFDDGRLVNVCDFAKRLHGINAQSIRRSLKDCGYFYHRDGHYVPYSAYRDSHFSLKLDGSGNSKIVATKKGLEEIVKQYNAGNLKMKVGRSIHPFNPKWI